MIGLIGRRPVVDWAAGGAKDGAYANLRHEVARSTATRRSGPRIAEIAPPEGRLHEPARQPRNRQREAEGEHDPQHDLEPSGQGRGGGHEQNLADVVQQVERVGQRPEGESEADGDGRHAPWTPLAIED